MKRSSVSSTSFGAYELRKLSGFIPAQQSFGPETAYVVEQCVEWDAEKELRRIRVPFESTVYDIVE